MNVADLVDTSGTADEAWAAEGYENVYRGARLIRLDSLGAAQQSESVPTAEAASPREAARGATAVAQDQSLLGELWLDPVIVRDAADAIARRLTTLRPPGEPDFHRNAAAVQGDID